jgi:hypothetical protein
MYLDKEDDDEPKGKKPKIVVTINIIDMRVSSSTLQLVDDVPDNSDKSVHLGCKKAENVDRFQTRSAGVMALVRPCGIVVDLSEMLTCESPSQLFVQALRLKCDENVNMRYFGYDRACEFAPFLRNLEKKGNPGAELLLRDTQFVVDRFHIKGHKAAKCDIKSPQCAYHPDLPRFDEIRGVNTECAEQCFAWLGKFKHMVKYMSQYKYKLFLAQIVATRNYQIAKKLNTV